MAGGGRTIERVGRRRAEKRRERSAARPHGGAEDREPLFPALHWMTAALFAAAGTEAALRLRGGRGVGDLLRIAPLLAAPLGSTVHVARARSGAPRIRLATQLVDGLAAGIAVAGVFGAAYNAVEGTGTTWPRTRAARRLASALVPLTFGATACLGLLLERQEDEERGEVERLRRRARIVERLVPQRRPRLDRIVVHV